MKPDSLGSLINVTVPANALPVSVLIVLLLLFGALIAFALFKASWFKAYAQDFPTQKATGIVGLGGFVYLVLIAGCRLALGMAYPTGYGDIALLVGGALGIVGASSIGKHAFSTEREMAKAEGAARVAAATPPQPTQVLAAGGSNVNVNTEAEPPTKPAVPRAGDKPDPRLPSPLDDESKDA